MSSVDNRIVKMQFDNAQFEAGVSQSMSTLDKLNEKLQFKGADKSLKNLQSSVDSVDFSRMTYALERLGDRFSALGVAGMEVVRKITDNVMDSVKRISNATLGQIKSGGWSRAMNLANAQFTVEGLKLDWEQLEKAISYGVKDTAYGLDAAAKAASSLAASGVKFKESIDGANDSMMHKSLRAISGVAAMTNSSYEDISRIFTTVAGQNRLMGDQLLQLAGRGLNVAATLGDQMGKSEKEIRDMVSKGEINFETFAKAMDDAFGAHAKEANKTFSGALSNMKAALSRIGALFASPIIEKTNTLFNTITKKFDAIKAGMSDTVKDGQKVLGFQSHFADAWKAILDVAIKLINKIDDDWLKSIGTKLDKFASKVRDIFVQLGMFIDNYSAKAKNGYSKVAFTIELLRGILSNFFKTVKYVKTAISIVLRSIFIAFARVFDLKGVSEVLATLSNSFVSLGEKILYVAIKASPYIIKAFEGIFTVGQFVFKILGGIVTSITDFIAAWKSGGEAVSKSTEETKKSGTVLESIKKIVDKLLDSLKELPANITELGRRLENAKGVTRLKKALEGLFKVLGEVLGQGLNPFAKKLDDVANKKNDGDRIQTIADIIDTLANTLAAIIELLPSWIRAIANFAKVVTESVKKIFTKVKGYIGDFFDSPETQSVGERFKNLISKIFSIDREDSLITKLFKFGQSIIGAICDGMGDISWEKVANIGVVAFIVKTLIDLSTMVSKVAKLPGTLLGVFSGLKSMFENLGKTMHNLSVANVIGTIMSSFAAILGLVWLLTKVPTEKLESAVAAVFAVVGAIVILMKAASKMAESISKTRVLDKVSTKLLSAMHIYALIGGAILLLGGIAAGVIIAIRAIPDDPRIYDKINAIGLTLLYVGGFILSANVILKKVGLAKGILKFLAMMVTTSVAIGASMVIIGNAMKKMPINYLETIDKLTSMILMLGVIVVFMKAIDVLAMEVPYGKLSYYYKALLKIFATVAVISISIRTLSKAMDAIPTENGGIGAKVRSAVVLLVSLMGFMISVDAFAVAFSKTSISGYYKVLGKVLLSVAALSISISLIASALSKLPDQSNFLEGKIGSAVILLVGLLSFILSLDALAKGFSENPINGYYKTLGKMFASTVVFALSLSVLSKAFKSLPDTFDETMVKMQSAVAILGAFIAWYASMDFMIKKLGGGGIDAALITVFFATWDMAETIENIAESLQMLPDDPSILESKTHAMLAIVGAVIATALSFAGAARLINGGKGLFALVTSISIFMIALVLSIKGVIEALSELPDTSLSTWSKLGMIGLIALAMVGAIAYFVEALSTISSFGDTTGMASKLLAISLLTVSISGSIRMVVEAVNMLPPADGKLWTKVGVIGLIMLAVAGSVSVIMLAVKSMSVGAILGAAAIVLILTLSIAAIVGQIVILSAAITAANLIGGADSIIVASGIIGGALAAMVATIIILSRYTKDAGDVTGLVGVLLSLTVVIVVIGIVVAKLSSIESGLIEASVALGIITGVILVGLVAMVAAIGKTGAGSVLKLEKFALAILLMSGGLLVIAVALAKLAKVPWQSLLKAGLALGVVLLALTGIAALVGKFKAIQTGLNAITTLVLSIGISVALLGAGMLALGAAIKIATPFMPLFAAGLGMIFDTIAKHPVILAALIVMFLAFAHVVSKIVAIIIPVLEALTEFIKTFFKTIGSALSTAGKKLGDWFENLTFKGKALFGALIVSLCLAVEENGPKIFQTIGNLILTLLDFLSDLAEPLIDKLLMLVIKILEGLAGSILRHQNRIAAALWGIVGAVIGLLGSVIDMGLALLLGSDVVEFLHDHGINLSATMKERVEFVKEYAVQKDRAFEDLDDAEKRIDSITSKYTRTYEEAVHYNKKAKNDELNDQYAYAQDPIGKAMHAWESSDIALFTQNETGGIDGGSLTKYAKKGLSKALDGMDTDSITQLAKDKGDSLGYDIVDSFNAQTKNGAEKELGMTDYDAIWDMAMSNLKSGHEEALENAMPDNLNVLQRTRNVTGTGSVETGFSEEDLKARAEAGKKAAEESQNAFQNGFNLQITKSKEEEKSDLLGELALGGDNFNLDEWKTKWTDAGFDLGDSAIFGVTDGMLSNEDLVKFATDKTLYTGVVNEVKSQPNKTAMYDAWREGVVDPAVNEVRGMKKPLYDAMGHAVMGLQDGFYDYSRSFKWAWEQFFRNLPKIVTDMYKIQSPSKLFEDIMEYVVLGAARGITENEEVAIDAMSGMSTSIVDSFGNPLKTVAKIASGELQYDPSIRPVLDTSAIGVGANSINSMFDNQNVTLSGFSGQLAADIGEMEASNADIIAELQAMREEMAAMGEDIANMQVVMDSGALVGAIAPGMDNALGMRNIYRGRGN